MLVPTSRAQETKKISQKVKIDNYQIKETFEVLKSDLTTKHGLYSASISGYSEKGQYNNGKKTGLWECYDREGLIHKYDYSIVKSSEERPSKMIVSIWELDDQNQVVKELSPRTIYFGGDGKMLAILVQCIRYPAAAVENNTQGIVHISAIQSKDGKISSEKPETNLGHGLEQEALRVFKLLPPDWIPVTENGKPVAIKIEYKTSFKLG